MLEIYNEQVRDLLNPKSNKKGGLKVRQHPKQGFYGEFSSTANFRQINALPQQQEVLRSVHT